MKKILVTGGTGYIGTHTAVELIEAGFEVVIIDNLSNSNIESLERIKSITGVMPLFEEFDLTDEEKLDMFFARHNNIYGVIHFAALKAVGESVDEPLKYYKNNLFSSINLFEAMKKHNVRNLIFSSSAAVYGQPDTSQITEESPVKKAENPYGNTKKIVEEITNDIANTKCINVIALRYFNVIGAHESGKIGDLPIGEPENLMPYITQTAIGVRKQLQVFGDDYNTPDGTCIRDYIHVVDLAKAHVKALQRLIEEKNEKGFEVYNLGTGKGCSVLELIKKFEQVNNVKVNYNIVERRDGDPAQSCADASLANEKLGWVAEKNIEDMVKSAWDWENNYRNSAGTLEDR